MHTQALINDVKTQLQALVAAKAGEDAGFRAAVLADPQAAICRLLAIDSIGGLSIRVVDEKPAEIVLVLPDRSIDGPLTDEQLSQVSAGAGISDNLTSLLAILNGHGRGR